MREFLYRVWNGTRMSDPLPLGSTRLTYIRRNRDEVMEYTGHEDRSRRHICESDLLTRVDWEQPGIERPDIYLVEWLGRLAAFNLVQHRNGSVLESQLGLTERPTSNYIIVGNMYENRDLLQGPTDA